LRAFPFFSEKWLFAFVLTDSGGTVEPQTQIAGTDDGWRMAKKQSSILLPTPAFRRMLSMRSLPNACHHGFFKEQYADYTRDPPLHNKNFSNFFVRIMSGLWIFHIAGWVFNSLGGFGRFLCFFFGACRKTVRSARGDVPVLNLFFFAKVAEPIPEPVDQSILCTISRIGGRRNTAEYKREDKKRDREFTHDPAPFPGLDLQD
jgi:hypothetical protein